MAFSWHDLVVAGAPAAVHAVAFDAPKPRKAAAPKPRKPVASASSAAPAAAPAFMFPGAVDILNAAPQAFDDDKENRNGEEEEEEKDFDSDDDDERYEFLQKLAAKWDCNAIRRKIQRFLARKTMTQTAFLRDISANPKSYQVVPRLYELQGQVHGREQPDARRRAALLPPAREERRRGRCLHARDERCRWRERQGRDVPRKEQNAKAQDVLDNIDAVALEEPVYVYDDCDEIRQKINELIESKTLTQAALLRHLDVNFNSLRRFLTTKGKREGCSNGVYYRAYCFFEKPRIAEGVAKTNKRLKKEKEMPQGYSLQRDPTHCWVYVAPPRG